jgi:hypothetical protein
MSDRWGLGLVAAAALCCALPLLVTAGFARAAWAAFREHWVWAGLSIGSVVLAVLWRARRAPGNRPRFARGRTAALVDPPRRELR